MPWRGRLLPLALSLAFHAAAIAALLFVRPQPHDPPEQAPLASVIVDVVAERPIEEAAAADDAPVAAAVASAGALPSPIAASARNSPMPIGPSEASPAAAAIEAPLVQPGGRPRPAAVTELVVPAELPASAAVALREPPPVRPADTPVALQPTTAAPAVILVGDTPARPGGPAAPGAMTFDPGDAAIRTASAAPFDAPVLPVAAAQPAQTVAALDASRPVAAAGTAPSSALPPPATTPVGGSEQLASLLAGPEAAGRGREPEREVDEILAGLGCARVGARLDAASGTVMLSGHVRSEDERARVVRRLGAVAGVARVAAEEVRIVGEPYCQILTFLGRAEFRPGTGEASAVAPLGLPAEAGVAHFVAGMPLELAIAAPAFDAFLYVDYFTADGRVFHLLPTERPDNRVTAGERFGIGERHGRGRPAVIAPPFGLDMVVILASSEPLFAAARPASEPAAAYLASLDAALAALQARGLTPRLEYAYHLIHTGPRNTSR